MSRKVQVGQTVILGAMFFDNGQLFDPYSIVSVNVETARVSGSILATLTPTRISVGMYSANWTVPAGTPIGHFYDAWTYQAQSSMSSNTRTYSFQVIVSETIVPETIGGPLYIGDKEINFFNSVNKELIQKVVAQKIIYYSVSEKHSKTHSLYDESINKIVYTPVEINARVMYEEPVQTANRFSIDTVYHMETYFHIHELNERNIVPLPGDFVKWGQTVYEIEKVTSPQIVFGQIQNKVMVKCNCRVSRKSQFTVLDGIAANSGPTVTK